MARTQTRSLLPLLMLLGIPLIAAGLSSAQDGGGCAASYAAPPGINGYAAPCQSR